jgi:AraC family transcriptional regulator
MKVERALPTRWKSPGAPPDSASNCRLMLEANGRRSSESTADRAGILVRRAISLLEIDREAASRCLKGASELLGWKSQDLGESTSPASTLFQPGGLARWQARRTLAYIEANLESKMPVRELANVVPFSRSHFSRAFKRSIGLPPMAYVTTRRVERAKVMMTSTPKRLTEIALACGFADQSHLIRWFRRIVGVSPGAWRRSYVAASGPSTATREGGIR